MEPTRYATLTPALGDRLGPLAIQPNNSNWPRQKTHHDLTPRSTSILIATVNTPTMPHKLVPFVC
jgi:hypothetical protein